MIDTVRTITLGSSSDSRGSFTKAFQKSGALADFDVQQVNFVTSNVKFTLRGMHYQHGEYSESKFFRVIAGSIQLGFVDVRGDSRTFASSGTITIDDPTVGVLVPRGFATGYLTLSAQTSVLYLSDRPYTPEAERGVRWDDPIGGLGWITDCPTVSDKDRSWPNWLPHG